MFSASARKKGKSRWGDKTPCHVLDVARLASDFPEAQFIHVIRDGRDVAASMIKAGWTLDARTAARLWKTRVEAGRAAGAALGAGRYREVRFEALVARPEDALRQLCLWVDIDYTPSMLRYYETAESRIVPQHAQFHRLLSRPPDASRALAWPRDLPRREVADFEAAAGELLATLGYPLTGLRIHAALKGARGFAKTVTPAFLRAASLLRRLGVCFG